VGAQYKGAQLVVFVCLLLVITGTADAARWLPSSGKLAAAPLAGNDTPLATGSIAATGAGLAAACTAWLVTDGTGSGWAASAS